MVLNICIGVTYFIKINILFFIADTITIFYQQLIEGLKRCLEQNKEMFKVIHEIKVVQEAFQKEFQEKINNLSEKFDQLTTPDDSYWKVIIISILYRLNKQ
jgi:hypothetical protein